MNNEPNPKSVNFLGLLVTGVLLAGAVLGTSLFWLTQKRGPVHSQGDMGVGTSQDWPNKGARKPEKKTSPEDCEALPQENKQTAGETSQENYEPVCAFEPAPGVKMFIQTHLDMDFELNTKGEAGQ